MMMMFYKTKFQNKKTNKQTNQTHKKLLQNQKKNISFFSAFQ